MELVYLWVEKYKNIEKQGFNFSPRFECEFFPVYEKYTDEKGEEKEKLKDDCELKITPKENPLKDFFGKNINVTAIVGENGSGKSNILELISNLGYYEDPYRKKDYPVSFSELNQITIYYDKLKNKLYIYKKNLITAINNKSSITEEEITNESIQKILIRPTPSHSQQEYLLLLDFLRNNDYIVFPFEIPKIISFGIHDDCFDLLELIKTESFDFGACYTPFEENQTKRLKIFHVLLLLAYLKNYKIDFNIQASENFDNTILELESKIDEDIKSKINNFIQAPLEDFSVITSHYVNIKNIPNDFFKIYIEIIKRKNDDTLLDFKGKNVFNFDLYPKMSDGQYQLTYIFNTIHSQINQDTIMLCIDEGENYLHPNWQKKYINYLHQFLKDNFSNKQIHLIVSSHSPFLLSDLPKENVIFLEKDEKTGNCKNVTKKTNIETFGANIHTLLSHGFFMKDGLMGEFAKGKINQVYNFITQKDTNFIKTKEEAQNIINLIGEPLIKKQLQKLFDETFDKNNLTLDDEIELLEKKLNALKELKK